MKDNILLVWDRMGDYHRARWISVQRMRGHVEVYAADLGAADKLYGWKNTQESPFFYRLSSKPPHRWDVGRIIKFIKILSAHDIGTVCVAGYGKPEYLAFILYGKLSGRKVILFAESWYESTTIIDKLKSFFLRVTCHGFLVSGRWALDHFTKRLKIESGRIRMGYSVVDNRHFGPKGRAEVPRGGKRLLSVARFSKEKDLGLLIRAFEKSILPANGWRLDIIGGGPLQNVLADEVTSGAVTIRPWQPYEQLPAMYHEADVFILPSKFEPWGLVVNEAMAAGLPVILSTAVGCLPDLMPECRNGWIFQAGDEESLISILNDLDRTSDEALRNRGSMSRSLVQEFSTDEFAKNLLELIDRK